jgi:hypothetical protein
MEEPLSRSRRRLSDGGLDVSFDPARGCSEAILPVFEAPIKDARPRRCEARQALNDLVLLREDAERRLLGRTSGLNREPTVRTRRRQLSELLDKTELPVEQLSLAEVRSYTKRLSAALDRLGAASRRRARLCYWLPRPSWMLAS